MRSCRLFHRPCERVNCTETAPHEIGPTFRCTDVHRRDAVVVLVHDGQELRLRLDDLITATVKGSIK